MDAFRAEVEVLLANIQPVIRGHNWAAIIVATLSVAASMLQEGDGEMPEEVVALLDLIGLMNRKLLIVASRRPTPTAH